MNKYLKYDNWKIVEEGFSAENVTASESIFSIGNGRMGQRANFEEKYSGESLQGSYIAGVYYPDKTKVGWWKNGYPEYFAKVLNAANWIGINVEVDGDDLDLDKVGVSDFKRTLHMREGWLSRSFTAETEAGNRVKVNTQRFLSIVDDDLGAIKYSVTSENFEGALIFSPYVDADVVNEDSNYDEKFWDGIAQKAESNQAMVTAITKKTGFTVTTAMRFEVFKNGKKLDVSPQNIVHNKYAECKVSIEVKPGDEVTIYKFATNVSSFNHPEDKLEEVANAELDKALEKHYDTMLAEQVEAWDKKMGRKRHYY